MAGIDPTSIVNENKIISSFRRIAASWDHEQLTAMLLMPYFISNVLNRVIQHGFFPARSRSPSDDCLHAAKATESRNGRVTVHSAIETSSSSAYALHTPGLQDCCPWGSALALHAQAGRRNRQLYKKIFVLDFLRA